MQSVAEEGSTWPPFRLPSSCLWVGGLFPPRIGTEGFKTLWGPTAQLQEEASPISVSPSLGTKAQGLYL